MTAMGGIRRFLAVLAGVVSLAAASDPSERLPDPAQEARARTIFKEVRCLVCQNESIDDSEAELAHDLRQIVRQQVKAGKSDAQIKQFLTADGYVEDERMTVSTEGNRYYFEHPETGLGVDVFMNELYFCHRIPFEGRLDLDRPTISTADLLLEKMQIVELNLKDITDTMVLMLEHPIANGDTGTEVIDGAYIADLLHDDWGFYYTVTTNLHKVDRFVPDNQALAPEQAQVIRGRLAEMVGLIEDAPKSRKWRLRAKVGPKKQWYQDVAPKGSGF